jgi:D-alanine-D-alanine ligase
MSTENKKLNILLLFGGRSGEHEVSLLSAKSVYEALNKEKYNITLVGIDKNGHWRLGEDSKILLNSADLEHIKLNAHAPEVATSAKGEKVTLKTLENDKEITEVDVVFPVMHGTFGEDGSIQGFLELLNVAYVGAGVLGSAVAMDKDVAKRLLKWAGLPVCKFCTLQKPVTVGVKEVVKIAEKEIKENLGGFPIFVKPANLGSSVGISKVYDEEELTKALIEAFQYDFKVILEEYIEGREIEVSVLGNRDIKASVPGEIRVEHDYYDYQAKYVQGSSLDAPAKLSQEETDKVQDLAIQAFKTLECQGMARVDFFLKETGEILINELNTIPGFTKTSVYPKLWEASGLPYSELIDNLLELAMERKKEKDILKRSYN